MLQKLSYKPDIQNGVLVGIKRNSIVLSDEPVTGFDNPVQLQEYVKVRKIPTLVYLDIEGDPEAAAQQYADYYANLEAVAIPWETGLALTRFQAKPISYDNKLYEVIQDIVVVDPGHTPDIVPAHYKEILKPAGSGYPEWVQPTSTVYYNKGDRMTYTDGKNYESLIDVNVWSPEQYPQGWKEIL